MYLPTFTNTEDRKMIRHINQMYDIIASPSNHTLLRFLKWDGINEN